MSKRYFINENPTCCQNPIWKELNGREFYCFLQTPAANGRYFIDMDDVVLECTKEQFTEHKAEKDHSDYLKEQEKNWSTVSIYCYESADGFNGEDVLKDPTQDVEETAIGAIQGAEMQHALRLLPMEDYNLLYLLYLSKNPLTEEQAAALCGLSQSGINRRKKKLFSFLKKVVIKGKKSSQ